MGSVAAFSGNTLPAGWLLCDGSAVSRTDYAALFAVIGTTYGAGDGSATFNLPNLTDKFIEGSSTSGTEHSAGLPNITGEIGDNINIYSFDSGAFKAYYPGVAHPYAAANNGDYLRFKFDASRSSAIYGNSNTVQPPALTMKYAIYSGVVSKKLWMRTI